MVPDRLKKFTEPQPVLDDGHIQLIDVMGDDHAIIDAARVSFFGKASDNTDAQNRHLLRYLMRGRHTTPFEMCEIKIRVRVPMDAWRQWIRHRTASVNESSTRYAPAIDSMSKAIVWRSQSKDNKQGSSGVVTDWPENWGAKNTPGEKWSFGGTVEDPSTGAWAPDGGYHETPAAYLSSREEQAQGFARKVYEERLVFGVAKEVARKDLPLSTYTEAYWKMDLHNLFHFLSLRMDPHAQQEIREYANAIAEIVKVWVPWAWEAFEDYRLQGMYLTRFDVAALKEILSRLPKDGYDTDKLIEVGVEGAGVKGREKTELRAKLNLLLGV